MEYCLNYRENLVNYGVRKTIHQDWEYLLMIDSHQVFTNPYWWEEAIWNMEHFQLVQLTQYGAHFNESNITKALTTRDVYTPTFAYLYQTTNRIAPKEWYYKGNVWGIRKQVYTKIGYIWDYCLLGACDDIFVLTAVRNKNDFEAATYNRCIYKAAQPWIESAMQIIQGSVTALPGNFYHLYHERVADVYLKAGIWERDCIQLENNFLRDKDFILHTNLSSLLTIGRMN
jgi:hypothetical protein